MYWKRFFFFNKYIGKNISIKYTGRKYCISCNTILETTYINGFCFKCFNKLASCDQCTIKPNLCHYHFSTCRDPAWSDSNCFIDHYVYLSKTSSIKVGITKFKQIPFRWMNQGAIQALPIIKTRSRYQAGLIESLMKNYITDKTSWKKMLLSDIEYTDIINKKKFLFHETMNDIKFINKNLEAETKILKGLKPICINYPLKKVVNNLRLVEINKNSNKFQDILNGIKGQYLIFDKGVINMKKYLGYEMLFTIS